MQKWQNTFASSKIGYCGKEEACTEIGKAEESSAEAKVTEDLLCARPSKGLTVLGEAP